MISEHKYKNNWQKWYYKFDSYKVFPDDLVKIMIKELGEQAIKSILSKYETEEDGFKIAAKKGEDQ